MMPIRYLLSFSLGLALAGAGGAALSQDGAAPRYPYVTQDHVSLNCKKSITRKGLGVCTGHLEVSLWGVPHEMVSSTFYCDVMVKYWQGQQRELQTKLLSFEQRADRQNAFDSSATIKFEIDLTSITRETQDAKIGRAVCRASWRYR